MAKKSSARKPKDLKVSGLYSSELVHGTAKSKNWFNENKEVLMFCVGILLAICGLCYKLGIAESEFRENIKAINANISQLQEKMEYFNKTISEMNREFGKHQAELNFLKERQ